MDIYSLSTTFGIIQKKHELGLGIGFLILNMGTSYSTVAENNEVLDLGGDHLFPMPFLAISGRLNFNRFHVAGSGGGAYFNGEMDGWDYKVWYYTYDIRGAYDFFEGDNWSSTFNFGWRTLVMDMSNSEGWAIEHDNYSGPFLGIRVKFSSDEKWISKPLF